MKYGPGASAHVWRSYLGSLADIYFLEFDRKCGENWYKSVGHKLNITMYYGSQDDITTLNNVKSKYGYFDVIVDDGGHTMDQQITSLINLIPQVKSGGIYVIEDLLTSYVPSYGGGYLVTNSRKVVSRPDPDSVEAAVGIFSPDPVTSSVPIP
ncbi:unnamed protein product [Adineta steineri]|uniref:Uncharacterized protein n=1 Tax=Adineta steineri TaxID=433720 RepID=A0A819XVP8_9BILA|nr:unnamed protein product [Adineta steineri]